MDRSLASLLGALGREQRSLLPPRARGTLRIDLLDGERAERWFIEITEDDLVVTGDGQDRHVDAVLTCTPELLVRLITGQARATAALLRNEASFAGDARLILALRRIFPSPPGTIDPRTRAQQHAPHGDTWRQRLDAHLRA